MQEFITNTVGDHGYLAVFVLMVLESACVPIPSEITMVFGGALSSPSFAAPDNRLDFVAVAVLGAAANVVGSWIAWGVGYMGGRPLVERWGRYVLLRPREIERAHDWFERHGEAAVFFSRLLPVVRTFISVPAGVVRMPFWRFTTFTFLGCLPWTFGLTGAGYWLGQSWHSMEAYFRPISYAVAGVVVLVIAVWATRRIRRKRAAP